MTNHLVWAPDEWDPIVKQALIESLPDGFELRFGDDEPNLRGRADFILAGPQSVTADLVEASDRLLLVQKWGIGTDSIDIQACNERGIGVAITAGANAHAVAEHTIMLILAVYRQLAYADSRLRQGDWVFAEMRARCRQLLGKTVGIVGLGNIGRAVARRLAGFETKIIYYDPVRPDADTERELGVSYVPMDELLATVDVVTLHCPGGDDNRHLIADSELRSLKGDAILINAARGELVDSAAIVAALRDGRLGGAGLDVFEDEPLTGRTDLAEFDNVILTPHTAASVLDNVPRVARHAFGNMRAVLAGEQLTAADVVVPPRRTPTATS